MTSDRCNVKYIVNKLIILIFLLSFGTHYAQESCFVDNCMLDESDEPASKSSLRTNIMNSSLTTCSTSPMTGYFRDGTCFSDKSDRANHSVCTQVTDKFLEYTKKQGNDLVTPNKRYNFPGLKEGDYWCLCASRWKQAKDSGIKLKVNLDATHKRALEVIRVEEIIK